MEIDNNNLKEHPSYEEFKKNLAHYRQTMFFLGGNVPIQVLCLPKVIETILIRENFERVYDLFHHDLTKIKGLGRERLDILTSRLDEFISISL